MALVLDADRLRSASHNNMIDHLAGPFLGGAVDRTLAIDASGHVTVSFEARFGVVLAGPREALDNSGLRLTARIDGTAADLPQLRFEPYTEAGAFLLLFLPDLSNAALGSSNRFGFTIKLASFDEDGNLGAIADADIAGKIDIHLLEGNLGRLMYVLGAEKLRIRQQARAVSAMRLLSRARTDALDRFGADLGVPRFTDQIRFDTTRKEIVTETLTDGEGRPVSESDKSYRRRLGLYRPFLIPNRRNILDLLNGPGADGSDNAGLMAGLGVTARFGLEETPNQFAVAMRLISTPNDQPRLNFISFVRSDYLIFPNEVAGNNSIHAKRFVPSAHRAEVEFLRKELRTHFEWKDDMGVAPVLAAMLRTLGRALAALGFAGQAVVKRAQSTDDGSRYEGVDIVPFTPQQLDGLITTLQDPSRPKATDPIDPNAIDEGTEALLASLQPKPSDQDVEGEWLFRACGLRTVHRVDANTLYLSHFPMFGLVVETSLPAAGTTAIPLAARNQAPGDPGTNAALQAALDAALPDVVAAGGEALTVLSDQDARAHFTQQFGAAPQPAITIFQAAALPAVTNKTDVVPQLLQLPPELLRAVKLGPNLTQRILAGQPGAADDLVKLTAILRRRGLVSVLPLVTAADEILMVISVVGLPGAGINLSDRRATGFRWYAVPISPVTNPELRIGAIGSRSSVEPGQPGLAAVVAVGYVRSGKPDPYEFRVTLPDQTNLNIEQYEFLMNLLERVGSVGIEINTFALRQEHVDLDSDGTANPMPPAIFRTFRRFRRGRQRGEIGVTLD